MQGNLIEKAAEAGLRSLFVGFETFSPENLKSSNKVQNLDRDYRKAVNRLHSLGIMINGSFVFGLDNDDNDVFKRTVDWGIENAITTATYHILTPYPGTLLFEQLSSSGRILTKNWDLYDTRHVVYTPKNISINELQRGYDWAYDQFYSWPNVFKSGLNHSSIKHILKHLMYTGGWKKLEPMWNMLIKAKGLNAFLPMLEAVLSKVNFEKERDKVTEVDFKEDFCLR